MFAALFHVVILIKTFRDAPARRYMRRPQRRRYADIDLSAAMALRYSRSSRRYALTIRGDMSLLQRTM